MTLVFSPQYRLVMQLTSAKARDRKPDSGISLPKIEKPIPAIANYLYFQHFIFETDWLALFS